MQTETISNTAPQKTSRWPRRFKVLFFMMVCGITLLALFHAEENLRGKQAWTKFEKEMEAKGEKSDMAHLIPPMVPDAENFAMTPFLAPLYDFVPGTQKFRDTNGLNRVYNFAPLPNMPTIIFWQLGRTMGLAKVLQEWQTEVTRTNKEMRIFPADANLQDRAQAATAVLQLFREEEPVLDELRLASHRPYARFNLAYDIPTKFFMLLPHLGQLRRITHLLELRAVSELALGKTNEAFADVTLMLSLADSIKTEPIIISHLVRLVMLQMAMQPLWEGMKAHQWNDAQLQQFQHEFSKMDLLQENSLVTRAEREMVHSSFFEEFRKARSRTAMLNMLANIQTDGLPTPSSNSFMEIGIRALIPTGWSYFEQINYERLSTWQMIPLPDIAEHRVHPPELEANWKAVTNELAESGSHSVFNHTYMAHRLLPSLGNLMRKSAMAQDDMEMAATACELERYYLANHAYPAKLESLVPRFATKLDLDVITGEPFKYRPTEEGRFVLYSVGWNEMDDGGKVAFEGSKSAGKKPSQINIKEGDWVWAYPDAGK